ncbi:DNA polymerase III subunit epsilon [Parasphingorhabdus flavimaris]|uniref:DNA polymerase III subunit epsilon n=1 Tax=Parasphingorhabdus flavimaris TaxID=266812 RepID=UPI00300256EB
MREIIFDTETTGFDPQTGDRMVEIGCIEMIDRIETGNSFHCYYNPERPMPKAAENVHGLSDIFLSDKKLFAQGAEELLAFLGDSNLVAHNAQFDFNFLNAELVLCGYKPISRFRMIDTLAIAKSKHPGAKLSLDALCSRYGIDRSHRVKHGALLDAELLTQLYIELTGGRQIGLGLADDSGGGDSANMKPIVQQVPRRPFMAVREHHASADELARHKKFIEGIESPLWTKL